MMNSLNVNKEVSVNDVSIRVIIEISPPTPLQADEDIGDEEKEIILNESYCKIAESLANYLCAIQFQLKENPRLGSEPFMLLLKHIASAGIELIQSESEIISKSEEQEKDSWRAYW